MIAKFEIPPQSAGNLALPVLGIEVVGREVLEANARNTGIEQPGNL